MKKDEKASIPLKKILIISIIVIFMAGASVMAANSKMNTVKIILSNNYEMTVLSNKSKVSDILEENHIIISENEVVSPKINEELSDNKTIRIAKEEGQSEIAENNYKEITTEKLLEENYSNITEKVTTEQMEIPFETITKDVSNGGTKQNKVVQNGVNGIKEVTYKIKYQDDVEIERIELSSKIIKEPKNKIIEVQTKKVTSRGGTSRGSTSVT